MSIITNPLYRPLFEVLKSARNGIVYGGKLRFLHALVINLLYRSGPIVPRLKSVLEATKDHAQVLAAFAIIYKACVMILKQDAFWVIKPWINQIYCRSFGSWIVYSQHFNFSMVV